MICILFRSRAADARSEGSFLESLECIWTADKVTGLCSVVCRQMTLVSLPAPLLPLLTRHSHQVGTRMDDSLHATERGPPHTSDTTHHTALWLKPAALAYSRVEGIWPINRCDLAEKLFVAVLSNFWIPIVACFHPCRLQ